MSSSLTVFSLDSSLLESQGFPVTKGEDSRSKDEESKRKTGMKRALDIQVPIGSGTRVGDIARVTEM